jgi:hypothetical protein
MRYFPFIRGKAYDLLALRDLLGDINNPSDFYLPIIEPVKNDMSNLKKLFDDYNNLPTDKKQKFILIANPLVGELKESKILEIKKVFSDNDFMFDDIIFAYQIKTKTELLELKEFQELFSTSDKKNKFVFIHNEANSNFNKIKDIIKSDRVLYNILDEKYTDRIYRNEVRKLGSKKAVVINDNFKVLKNANYPDDDFFSDLYAIHFSDLYAIHEIHEGEKYEGGFGDYLTVGRDYRDTGGPAYAIAIHLTYFSDKDILRVRHFKSKTNDTPVDVAGKFAEALDKMFRYINNTYINRGNPSPFGTKACKEFERMHKEKTYKGLGYIKKLSIKHHIELIVNKIKDKKWAN